MVWLVVGFLLKTTLYPVQAQNPTYRIMTFNIRYDNPADSLNSWHHRRDKVKDLIEYHQADLVGMQEALYHQVMFLDSTLQEFDWVGVGRNDGYHAGEFNPVFYNKNEFRLQNQGTFWLSETPDKPGSKGWDAACPRICTWASFLEKKTQKTFFVFNTHLDHQGTIARIRGTEIIINHIQSTYHEMPVIFIGDFNSLKGSAPYQLITYWDNPVRLKDTRFMAEENPYGPETTFIGFEPHFDNHLIIDHIFVNDLFHIKRHVIISDRFGSRFPSDHLPVLIEINFKSNQ